MPGPVRKASPCSRVTRLIGAGLGVSLLMMAAVGCGAMARGGKQTATTKHGIVSTTLRLDWIASGYHAPFFVAEAKGYYQAKGIDVHISDGKGSPVTAEDVAAGHDTFGVASADSAATVISKGGPIKVVADFIQQSPGAVIFRAGAPIHSPTDLYGKKVGVPPGSAAGQLWDAFVAANHLDVQRMSIIDVTPGNEATFLREGKIDAMSAFDYSYVPVLARHGFKTRSLEMADYGVAGLSEGIVVNTATLKNHPNWVRGFLGATIRAFKWTSAHPRQAIAIERRFRPKLDPEIGLGQWKTALQLLHTKASHGKPIGWMARSDWRSTIRLAHRFEGMKKTLPLADYYTDAYLPGS